MTHKKSNRPHEYVVYKDCPPWDPKCVVRTIRIPRGKHYADVRDRISSSAKNIRVVRAYSAATARSALR